MPSTTWFCLIRLLIVVLGLLFLVSSSSVTARGFNPPNHGDPNNGGAPSCSPFSSSRH
ncbi:hypothetical protein PVAP13_4KG165305 [Panicum virgatum]|uniref:Uncharacterized protein n=1 Tax=Panicum virgatum TaxID=38727 RepID=A0A8T0TTX6_PANVG|nr:hypothetical protein PVAP13_4KG165305 [Panicum virgatum]